MKIVGYSERGIMNALFYGIALDEKKDGLKAMREFLRISGVDNYNNYIDFELYPEFSLSDFGDPDILIKAKQNNGSYTLFFVMAIMLAVAEPFIRVLLTEKWIESVPYFQITCITVMLRTISNSNLQSYKAVGRSDIVLKLEIILNIINLKKKVNLIRDYLMNCFLIQKNLIIYIYF